VRLSNAQTTLSCFIMGYLCSRVELAWCLNLLVKELGGYWVAIQYTARLPSALARQPFPKYTGCALEEAETCKQQLQGYENDGEKVQTIVYGQNDDNLGCHSHESCFG